MKHQETRRLLCSGKHLGDYESIPYTFSQIDHALAEFTADSFLALGEHFRSRRISEILLQLIREEPTPSFLLIPIVDFIERIKQLQLLEHYSFSHFELWLNQVAGLSFEENYMIRAKIVGKNIPRDEYQALFPIGQGKTYPGTHFVTAHNAPDVDTTIASFWGWVDAVGARVGEGMHIWNLPGGPPPSQVEISLLFYTIFGTGVFDHFAKTRSALSLFSLDLMSQSGLVRQKTDLPLSMIDHEGNQNAVILVDEQGRYLDDWRNADVEGVRQVVRLLNSSLRWFGSLLQIELISLFGKKEFTSADLFQFTRSFFNIRIAECEPLKEFSSRQIKHFNDFLAKVLDIIPGVEATFAQLAHGMKRFSLDAFDGFIKFMETLSQSELFDSSGRFKEDRQALFTSLEKIVQSLNEAINQIHAYVDTLHVGRQIKSAVLGYQPQVASYRDDVEEIRSKMDSFSYLTVTFPETDGAIPLGVIHATDLYKTPLGTVSLRDFCNREETKIPPYLEVISVIDHHKTSLSTFAPPVVHIGDAQSANVVVAELAFQINDRYSTNGMTIKEIEEQMQEAAKELSSPSQKRIFQRLLQRHLVAERKGGYFIDSQREFVEYLHFLHAIFDDTDLLSKLSFRDVHCVASLINRMKSLLERREVELIAFDDLPRDEAFTQRAAARILQNPEVYSLYRKIYLSKEMVVEENIRRCVEGDPSSFLADTKEQNRCCRVGQSKLFTRNFTHLHREIDLLRSSWFEESQLFYKEAPEFDLYLHMISTVASAEDLFAGSQKKLEHQDQLWIWIPSTEESIEHLKSFLHSFSLEPVVVAKQKQMQVEFLGDNAEELEKIFTESFLPIERKVRSGDKRLPLAIIYYPAGMINSRKSMITPHLPG